VREIEADDIDAGPNQLFEYISVVGGGAEGGNDLGMASHGLSLNGMTILSAAADSENRIAHRIIQTMNGWRRFSRDA
jgi:hypothetical protein